MIQINKTKRVETIERNVLRMSLQIKDTFLNKTSHPFLSLSTCRFSDQTSSIRNVLIFLKQHNHHLLKKSSKTLSLIIPKPYPFIFFSE